MSVSFWFPDYIDPRFAVSLNNTNAGWLLRLAHIDHDPDCPSGEITPEELWELVYNLEQFILEHRADEDIVYYHLRNLNKFSRLLGFADSSGCTLSFG